MAIETLHETVLNDGKGPMAKVMFAEAPKTGQGQDSFPYNPALDLPHVLSYFSVSL